MRALLVLVVMGMAGPAMACDMACQIDRNYYREVDRRERALQQSFDNESRYFLHRQEERDAYLRSIDQNRELRRIGDGVDALVNSPPRW